MKATELRLGNLIYVPTYSKEAVIVDAGFRLDRFFENFEPEGIPLTEEWLEKFGVEKSKEEEGFYDKKLSNNDILAIHPKAKFCLIGSAIEWTSSIKLKYVHQLQNLIFALTGKELIIKKMASESV